MHHIPSTAPINDQTIEREIVDKGLTAARVTPSDVEAAIASEYFFTAADGLAGANVEVIGGQCTVAIHACDYALLTLTFCVLVLRNGFTVTGESACASPQNFDAEIGRKIARENAKQKLWPLLGYALKDRLHAASASAAQV